MKPTDFPEMNSVYGKDSKRFAPLPAHTTGGGHVISCWKTSVYERLRILITGRIYVSQLTEKKGLQPYFVSANRLELFTYKGKNKPFEAKVIDVVYKILGLFGIETKQQKIRRTFSKQNQNGSK